ncbi:ABC transporter permease [Marinitenerispora sediminis]|uniref:ABC transporter permease n=1 Tax=Marinitenerispora sediminis TaxID=1931232 RepID=A0A368T8J5_9ACTN|nr:ABC transporter permease [Marinitenerispora sediminis]RCV55056.1 ABC transporter permease [Marinitenerispora sediminis]RCV58021.1 ABC transporter permease [Marinitenerispora sediminis]RCV60702.1 ABC transporter permease [Marinitenerispora sediminis]
MTPSLPRRAARRLLSALLVVWGAATISFCVLHLIPGDPVDAVLGPLVGASPELRARVRAELGLDAPLWVQYLTALARLAALDLGWSYRLDRPVADVLADQLWPTVELAVAALVLAVLLAGTAALATAGRRGLPRAVISGAELVGAAVPSFWVGVVALTFLSFRWGLFPGPGAVGPHALVLPALTLAVPIAGVLAQVLRRELDDTLGQPFVTSVRARGVGRTGVLVRHALRHAAVPLLTLAGWVFAGLLSGTVLVETVFARPGLGRVLVSAVTARDIPVVNAVVVISAAAFVTVNLAVDALYRVVDPRLRASEAP